MSLLAPLMLLGLLGLALPLLAHLRGKEQPRKPPRDREEPCKLRREPDQS